MNCICSPVPHAGHCSKVGGRGLRHCANTSESGHQGAGARKGDGRDRTEHRNLDTVPCPCRSAVGWRDSNTLSLRSGERDRTDPQCRVFGVSRPDHGYSAITQRDEHATHAPARERPRVEILALHHDDRVGRRGTKSVQLLPEPARGDGGMKVANRLPFDLRLCPDDIVTCRERRKFDPGPKLLERRRNTARDLAMIRGHHEGLQVIHRSEHAHRHCSFLVAMRRMATKTVAASSAS